MATIAKRERLRQYIDAANNHDVDDLLEYINKGMEPVMPYNKWDDPEFVTEMDRRLKALEDGASEGYTWEEVKAHARQALKQKTAK